MTNNTEMISAPAEKRLLTSVSHSFEDTAEGNKRERGRERGGKEVETKDGNREMKTRQQEC